MTKTFKAQIQSQSDEVFEKIDLIYKQSVQDFFEDAQKPKAKGGNMPVDTGALRNSLTMSINGGDSVGGENPHAYQLALANMEFGDTAVGAWGTEYAMRMEFGFKGEDALGRTYNQAGNFFVRNAAQKWAGIVAKNAERVVK